MTTITLTIDDSSGFASNLFFPSTDLYRSAGVDGPRGEIDSQRYVNGVPDTSM
jgi:hypothetical protein